MSTVQEIKAAIRNLSSAEREELIAEMPALLPELNGDAAWERIIHDSRPRPALTALVDEIEAEYRRDPNAFSEIQTSDFDAKS
jgi:hypothetical protein